MYPKNICVLGTHRVRQRRAFYTNCRFALGKVRKIASLAPFLASFTRGRSGALFRWFLNNDGMEGFSGSTRIFKWG